MSTKYRYEKTTGKLYKFDNNHNAYIYVYTSPNKGSKKEAIAQYEYLEEMKNFRCEYEC